MANIEKRYFTTDNCETYYEGYDRGDNWNGWACPLFEKSVAENICKKVDDGETIITSYDKEKDCFKVKDTNNDVVSVFYGENFKIEGETKHLYPIGSGEWTWDSYTKEEIDENKNSQIYSLQELIIVAEKVLTNAPEEKYCTAKENELYSDIANIMAHREYIEGLVKELVDNKDEQVDDEPDITEDM